MLCLSALCCAPIRHVAMQLCCAVLAGTCHSSDCCGVPCCAVLCCAVLWCAVVWCAVVWCAVLACRQAHLRFAMQNHCLLCQIMYAKSRVTKSANYLKCYGWIEFNQIWQPLRRQAAAENSFGICPQLLQHLQLLSWKQGSCEGLFQQALEYAGLAGFIRAAEAVIPK